MYLFLLIFKWSGFRLFLFLIREKKLFEMRIEFLLCVVVNDGELENINFLIGCYIEVLILCFNI